MKVIIGEGRDRNAEAGFRRHRDCPAERQRHEWLFNRDDHGNEDGGNDDDDHVDEVEDDCPDDDDGCDDGVVAMAAVITTTTVTTVTREMTTFTRVMAMVAVPMTWQ